MNSKSAQPAAILLSTISIVLAVIIVVCPTPARAGSDGELSPVAKTLDRELKILEYDLVPLAEEMPADKYDFAPTAGEFKGVRTFGQQISHLAVNIYNTSAVLLGEKLPPELAGEEMGPASLTKKAELVGYLKGAIAYGHRAMATLTAANLADTLSLSWGKMSRLFIADLIIWHSYDHYGQLVVYLRMNGFIPPSSKPRK